MDHKEVLERVRADGVRFVSLQFSDVTGALKSVDLPVERLPIALGEGIWFDGSSVEGFARIQESDMHLRIDSDTYAVLPWSPLAGGWLTGKYRQHQTPPPDSPPPIQMP